MGDRLVTTDADQSAAVAKRFGHALNETLGDQHLGRDQLARKLEWSPSMLTSYMLGDRLVPLWRVPVIEDALRVRRGLLLERAGLVDVGDRPTIAIAVAGGVVTVNGVSYLLAPGVDG
jgi:hypothetical protein